MSMKYNTESLTGNMVSRTLALGAVFVSAYVAAEMKATENHRQRHNRKARLLSSIKEEGRPVYIMPGCRTDGEYIGGMFEPHMEHIGTIHKEAYSDDDFDLEDIKKKELEARARDMGRAAIVYCSSMGGMKFAKSLTDPEYRQGFGEIDVLILDSCPADREDIDTVTRLAMFASKVLPPSFTISKVYRSFMRRAANRISAHSTRVTDEEVRGHLLSSAETPLRAVKYQAAFIDQTHLSDIPDGELSGAAKVVYYLSSQHDTVINTDNAYKEYSRIFGGNVIRLIDTARDKYGHADGPEHPDLIIQLMEGNVPLDDHEGVARLIPMVQTTPAIEAA